MLNAEVSIQHSAFSILFTVFCLLAPALVLQYPPQQELDLAVQAAQVVVCPALNGVENVAVDSQEEWLPVGHGGYW